MISVSQDPQSRYLYSGQAQRQQQILGDLEFENSRMQGIRGYQNADLNDSHMDMSLSVVSNQTQIENKFNNPNALEEKYGLDLGVRKRTRGIDASVSGFQGSEKLNKSVLENLEKKTNTELFRDVSKGYFDNLGMSFRRVLTSMGHNLDEQRQLLVIREKLRSEGDEVSLEEV